MKPTRTVKNVESNQDQRNMFVSNCFFFSLGLWACQGGDELQPLSPLRAKGTGEEQRDLEQQGW